MLSFILSLGRAAFILSRLAIKKAEYVCFVTLSAFFNPYLSSMHKPWYHERNIYNCTHTGRILIRGSPDGAPTLFVPFCKTWLVPIRGVRERSQGFSSLINEIDSTRMLPSVTVFESLLRFGRSLNLLLCID